MSQPELVFVIPTYRLRDVCETVATYDENFWNKGHSPRIIVFDDSSVANHEKYYSLLEKTRTWSDVFYVGPKEKEAFSHLLHKRLRDRKLGAAVRNLFRPSYGWPTLVEICYFRKQSRELPQTRVANQKKKRGCLDIMSGGVSPREILSSRTVHLAAFRPYIVHSRLAHEVRSSTRNAAMLQDATPGSSRPPSSWNS